jgi:hypothetical protein
VSQLARDRANINTNIHTDQDWRDLTIAEQHLYWLLSTHPDLNYVGVVDWRTARLSAMAADATREGIQATAESLQEKRFVFIDEDTEEILVRSFMRHDGLLKQPKLSISMVNAYGSVASKRIREVVTFELQRLHTEYPDWAAFRQEKVMALVKGKGTDMAEFTLGFTHSFTPAVTPPFTLSLAQADPLPTSTATTTTTNTSSRRSPERGIPDDWEPTAEHRAKAEAKHLDVTFLAEAFRNHAEANDRRARNWDAAFRNWILKATPGTPPAQRSMPAQYAWANQ